MMSRETQQPTRRCLVKNLVKTPRLAEILDVSEYTLRAWRSDGDGPPFIKVGGTAVRYDLDAVNEWLAEQATETS
jgi:phage terminase Nu1 subunit (DNA packaging protein)